MSVTFHDWRKHVRQVCVKSCRSEIAITNELLQQPITLSQEVRYYTTLTQQAHDTISRKKLVFVEVNRNPHFKSMC